VTFWRVPSLLDRVAAVAVPLAYAMSCSIVIVDYRMGNLNSVRKQFERLRANVTISDDPAVIARADKVVLPGVGHFQKAMNNLASMHLVEVLSELVLVKEKPILGICLGMQLLAKSSEESESGPAAGLGFLDATVVRFRVAASAHNEQGRKMKVPHMGWNQISHVNASPLMKGIDEASEFYFVHSYHAQVNDPSIAINKTQYVYDFVSAVAKSNVFGVQYHPEKSHEPGCKILKNFVEL
jgi:imidazole glycerol-phosphate synthase subunit HisH